MDAKIELIAPPSSYRMNRTGSLGTAHFLDVPDGEYGVIVSATSYVSNTFSEKISGDLSRTYELNQAGLSLPQPNTPSPGSLGYCTITRHESSFGATFGYQHPDFGEMNWGWMRSGDAEDHAKGDPRCFTPPLPPPPSAREMQSNIINAVGNSTSTIQQEVAAQRTLSSTIMAGLQSLTDSTAGTLKSISDSLSSGLGSTLEAVGSLSKSVSDGFSTAFSKLDAISSWQVNFKFPSWDEVIVQPVNALLQPARDVLEWTKNFQWPDWEAVVIGPILNRIDAWFSNLLGIDPAKPFWDELEAKLYTLIRNMLERLIDELTSEFPENEKKV